MATFGCFFVTGLLREAGWPRPQGLLRKEVIDTMILDSAIDQMIDWSAAIGAGRPRLGLQVIAEMFRDRNWQSGDAPNIKMFVEGAASQSWNVSAVAAPHTIVQPVRFSKRGATVNAKDLSDHPRIRAAIEEWCLEGLLWGLTNPIRFQDWYRSILEDRNTRLPLMRDAGLEVGPMPDFAEFLDQSEDILRDYEREIKPLPSIPERLLADARALGCDL